MHRFCIIFLAFAFAGCASAPAPINCPKVIQYTDLEQSALRSELQSDGPETQVQIEDYAKLRAACAAGEPLVWGIY